MTSTNGEKYFAHFLSEAGVTHVFYLPAILLKGLAEMENVGISRIMVHGEKAAAYMADGYARVSGRPGVCLAQQIGASNLAAGLRDAYMASTPLIAITGGPNPNSRHRHAYQEVDDFAQFDSVTKFNGRLDNVARLPDLMRQAFREATSGTPGPAHLQVAGAHGNVLNADADLEMLVEPAYLQAPAIRTPAGDAEVAEAMRLLTSAKRPIIVMGGGAVYSGAGAALVELAERLDIPVATSMNAKGTIPDDHPLAVGVVGTYSRFCANMLVHEADLVFFVGSHTGGQVTHNWAIPAKGTPVIQLDINASELGRNYPNAVGLCGDARTVIEQLVDAAPSSHSNPDWHARVEKVVGEWRADADLQRNSDAVPMRPERICKAITDALPEGAVVVSDTGHSGMWSGTMIDLKASHQYIRCAGSMGWGFPASLGAKCAAGDRPVVCWTGDGAFYYHIAELETAARYGINVVVVVNNNSALNQEIPLVDAAYGGTQSEAGGDIWRFRGIDFAAVAESFGCVGIRAETPEQVDDALKKAFTLDRPVVIDAVSDVDAFARRAWVPEGGTGHGH